MDGVACIVLGISAEVVWLKEVSRTLDQAMQQLDQQQQALLQQTQQAIPPTMPVPAPDTANQSTTSRPVYAMHSKTVTLQCHGQQGIQSIKETWTDRDGKKHHKAYTKKVPCTS